MNIPDIPFEAAFLRAALLAGLVREPDVTGWADALMSVERDHLAPLADVALARQELTAMREALRPLADLAAPTLVPDALLQFISADPGVVCLPLADRLRALELLDRESLLPRGHTAAIDAMADRLMLANAGIATAEPPSIEELDTWLASVRAPGFYRITVEDRAELAALAGALSRKLASHRRVGSTDGRAWLMPLDGTRFTLIIDDALWAIALREFSPLPLASRIPYTHVPAHATIVLDGSTAEPMGAADAAALLGAV